MIELRKSSERGHAMHGWLESRHTFSFASYNDPAHTHFRSLRVINEDRVAPRMGFGSHSHSNMEIISYVVSGALRHRDSMGNTAVMGADDVQHISAGTGISHSEFNDSSTEPVHFLQIWILPAKNNLPPRYSEKSFSNITPGHLHLVTSGTGRDSSIKIGQDADLHVAKLQSGQNVTHQIVRSRYAWIQMIDGGINANGTRLNSGDGATVSDVETISLTAIIPSHFLLFDLA